LNVTRNGSTPHKPAPMPVIADNVPSEIRGFKRWVLWNWSWKPKKNKGKGGWDKPPLQLDGTNAQSNNPETWCSFEEALQAHREGRFDGIGIVLGELGDGRVLSGLDRDDVRDPVTGEVEPGTLAALDRLRTYAEVSPSATGVKALGFGRLPPDERKDQDRGIEMYEHQYFTITGNRLPDSPAGVRDCNGEWLQLHAELFPPPKASPLSDRELALEALEGLKASRADDYWPWLRVGMALHAVDPSLLPDWERWSSQGESYEEGVCARKWKSFGRRTGYTLGSLIYWAQQDGWALPRGGARTAAPTPPGPGANGQPPTAYDVILADLGARYQPTFRRGDLLYSAALGREVRRGEACAAPPIALVEALLAVSDCPCDQERKPRRDRVPQLYRTWAPSAWVDLLAGLPEEAEAAEVSETAADQVRRRLASALYHVVALGHTYKDADGVERTEVQRRSLLDWCQLLARPSPWKDIRSYCVWCRLTAPRDQGGRLQVAVRVELHTQVGPRELADLPHRAYAEQAEVYGVGRKAKAGGQRAVVLADDYLAGLLEAPDDADGRMDVDGETHAGAREACVPASNSAQGDAAPRDSVDADVDGGPSRASMRPRGRAGRGGDVDGDDAVGRCASALGACGREPGEEE
jgi:Primase C terminal 2 (PriCT-2)